MALVGRGWRLQAIGSGYSRSQAHESVIWGSHGHVAVYGPVAVTTRYSLLPMPSTLVPVALGRKVEADLIATFRRYAEP